MIFFNYANLKAAIIICFNLTFIFNLTKYLMPNSPSHPKKPSLSEIDWYAIACKIRTQNQKLKQQIVDLESLIHEQKQQIKIQVVKNQDCDLALNEKDEEKTNLENEYEEQLLEKEEQIEEQQVTINQLAQELEKIQQQAARLERECSLLQEKYNEQQNTLQRTEVENKDLRVRLQRQQRYNLQYKTALDKFLDTSSAQNNDLDNNSIGIQSWSDSESSELDSKLKESEGWEYQSGIESDESQVNSEENFSSSELEQAIDSEAEAIFSESENNLQQKKADKSGQKKGHGKLFLKLPQFGGNKKNQEEK